jgi:hypothetical protein
MKKDKRIVYHKNKKNIGFSQNLKQSYHLAKGKFILFMGDDDIFLDRNTLQYFTKAFDDKSVGVVKAAQLLYKKNGLNQAYPIATNHSNFTTFEAGLESYRELWFESLSITGLSFRICPELFSAINLAPTLYPQVEHMGILCLTYKSVCINKYLVGVQSHDGQLNCISYYLGNKKTDLLNDWMALYKRISKFAKHKQQKFLHLPEFKAKLASFIPLFFPYNRLTNGITNSLIIVIKTIQLYPPIIFNKFFVISSIVSLILPKLLLRLLIEKIKAKRLRSQINEKEISGYNKLLKQYYT